MEFFGDTSIGEILLLNVEALEKILEFFSEIINKDSKYENKLF